MRKYVFILIGGFLGAISRYAVKTMPILRSGAFPLNTLIINIAGSFLLAAIFAAATDKGTVSRDIRLGATAGLLGAFTTFSTLCKETAVLITNGNYFIAALYIASSVALGLAAAFSGFFIVRKIKGLRNNGVSDTGSDGE